MDPRDIVVLENLNVIGTPGHQVREAFVNTDHLMPSIARLERYGANSTIDAGSGTAADQDAHAIAL